MRILVVDDELPARHRIRGLLEKFRPSDEIFEVDSGLKAINAMLTQKFDLIFLDIQLKDMSGFEVLQNTASNYSGDIIFVTAYDGYAIKAFETNAIDYLLKPFDDSRFLRSIQRVNCKMRDLENLLQSIKLKMEESEPIIINDGAVNHFFKVDQLLYIKSDRYYNNFYTVDKQVLIRSSLKELLPILPDSFIKINRSVIINTTKVKSA
ncbi:MAG: LytTR family DNA-binding domain-containing protein, partial [Bacteroidota bacterium]